MPFQTQQHMHIQHQNWKNNNRGGKDNGRGSYRGKRKGNRNGGNGGNDGNSWNPGNANNNSGGGQQHQPWRRHLTTGKFIDPKNINAFNNDKYCWTNGGNIANDHTSQTCSRQHPSGMHNANATIFFFGVRQESNDNIRVNRYQHTIVTTTVTGTQDVPGYDQSHTSTNIPNAVSNTTTYAYPAPKLEK